MHEGPLAQPGNGGQPNNGGQGASSAGWSTWPALSAVLTVLAVCLVFLGLYRFYSVVFLLFVAIALQVALDPMVRWLVSRRVPRMAAVLLIYAAIAALAVGAVVASAPTLVAQSQQALAALPASYSQLRADLLHSPAGLVRSLGAALPLTPSPAMLAGLTTRTTTAEAVSSWQWVGWLVQGLFAVFAVLALAVYWTQEGEVILRKLVLKAQPARREPLRAFIAESQVRIGAFFRGQAVLCAAVGVAATILFLVLGIPNALVLGLAVAVFEIVPVIGPLLGAVPAIIVTASEAPDMLPWVILGLLVIQILEANILVPRVMKDAVGVSAVVSILALAAFGALFGLVGALLAIPLAAILQILLARWLFDVPIGDETALVAALPENMGRSRQDVLRLESSSLVQAIRRHARSEDDPTSSAGEVVEDELEAIAAAVEALLAGAEGSA
jgi:predicted PurR-regulated permease PerM